ncbi:protein phosphatase [Novymonas esmeraldas]|uniref:protein-tyrosine-phosphatase n=1 Tax=Novymonas esmeraldas TaxID=1808958 RepID=A0AAW0F2W7_9TRYP
MYARCCTPPSLGVGDDAPLPSCRHRLFANEEDDHAESSTAPEANETVRPSGSFPRLSSSRTSGEARVSDMLEAAIVELPSPPRLPRSPRRAFQPIPTNLSSASCCRHATHGGRSVEGGASDAVAHTPRRSATSTATALTCGTAAAAAGTWSATVAHLQTPEVQRTNAGAATPGVAGHLLFTPQIPPLCQAWRANLDAELDRVNAHWAPDQQPAVTTLIDHALYVGGCPDAQTLPQLQALGVRHILNCCDQDIRTPPDVAARFHLHTLTAYDAEEYLILYRDYHAFAALVSTILASGESIFVHCIAGVNRSVTLCAAYLVDRLALNPVEVVRMFRANGRMRILDNRGFRHQLVDHYLQSVEPHKARAGLY